MKVFWLDRQQAIQRIRQAAQSLGQQKPEIERIILFGSLARGDAVPGSDADILIIVSDIALPFEQRSVHYRPDHLGIGADVFVYTQEEVNDPQNPANAFIAEAMREGLVLYERIRA